MESPAYQNRLPVDEVTNAAECPVHVIESSVQAANKTSSRAAKFINAVVCPAESPDGVTRAADTARSAAAQAASPDAAR